MIVTEAWLRKHASAGIGWTKKQFMVLGLPARPRTGWLKKLVGSAVTDAQAALFEELGRKQKVKYDRRRMLRGSYRNAAVEQPTADRLPDVSTVPPWEDGCVESLDREYRDIIGPPEVFGIS